MESIYLNKFNIRPVTDFIIEIDILDFGLLMDCWTWIGMRMDFYEFKLDFYYEMTL